MWIFWPDMKVMTININICYFKLRKECNLLEMSVG